MSFSIQITGLEELQNQLTNVLPEKIKGALQEGVEESALIMQTEITASINGERDEPRSVDTGFFVSETQKHIGVLEAQVFNATPYGVYLEEGTSKIGARHHFGNSIQRQKDAIKKTFIDAIKKEL